MDLSIIIVSFNTKELLKKCLESVVSGQRLVISERNKKTPVTNHQSPTTEIIVVDNGSTDGTVEEIENLKFKIGKPNLKLKIIKNEKNLGFAKAVNRGLRVASGETFLVLNSDTQVRTRVIEKLLEFEEKVRPAIIGARLLDPDGSVQPSVFHLPTVKGAILEFWLGRKGCFSKYTPIGDKPVEVEAVSGGAMLISKGVIEKIGLLDERYFMYFEDLDYCRRARKAGFKVWYLPQAEVIHEHGASGRSLSEPKNQWRRLIPSSKIYHGVLKHDLISFILSVGQKLR